MDPVIPPVQSAQLPIMEPDVVDLIQMIDEGKSCNSIFRQLCNSSLVANATIADLNTNTNRALFHSLPLPLLRSLLMGTLGSHFYNRNAMRDNWNTYLYDDNYAALKMYSAGVRLYEDYYTEGYRAFGTADREALEFTQVIDDELREVAHWDSNDYNRFNYMERPRFAKSETHVFQLQSPMMHMGLEARSTVFPILLAWEEDQIDPSGVLGTALANSRLPGHGYNVKMPGTRGSHTPNPRLEEAKEHVFYWKPFLRDNLQQFVDELGEDAVAEERAALTRALAHAREAIDGAKDALDELQKVKIEYEQVKTEWKEAIEANKAYTEAMKRACAEYDKLVEEDEDFLQMVLGN
ncbi:hypothetical protein E0Z10_g4296 [Xylaria hypoxylon]|uniref:Uncharacterized protein n=1 Tax=Xylaria hypoxylon TaxID=37992 RepID=A0A4Z0YZ22_9PEZI|nr:hypothetical protein E0Z10_g4296 [Xylaria hypoxylon]